MNLFELLNSVPSLKQALVRENLYNRALAGERVLVSVTITPDEASILLEHHRNNRPPMESNISYLVDSMLRGEFDIPGETTPIDRQGITRGSRHRLMASVMSQMSITQDFVINASESQVLRGYNEGSRQNNAVRLSNLGVELSTRGELAKGAKIANAIPFILYGHAQRLTNEQLQVTFNTFEEGIRWAVTLGGSNIYKNISLLTTLAIAYPHNRSGVSDLAQQLNINNAPNFCTMPWIKNLHRYIKGDDSGNSPPIDNDDRDVEMLKMLYCLHKHFTTPTDGGNVIRSRESLLFFLESYSFYRNRRVRNVIPKYWGELVVTDELSMVA